MATRKIIEIKQQLASILNYRICKTLTV